MHIIFWVAILSSKFIFPVYARILEPHELGKGSLYIVFFPPVFFYGGYFAAMKFKWKINYLVISILGIVSLYLILFLMSEKVFAYALIPISSFFLWITIGSLFRFFIDWFNKKNELIILEKENLASNMALLQSQINPHFLFNTLHNIDLLIFDNQEKASKSIIKLSDIMRYMLNDAKSDLVELQKEIEHLENYLSLEQIRLKNKVFLSYSISGNYNGINIAPMILIPFVENAFKHSVDSTIENGIEIELNIKNKTLIFTCKNQFDKTDTEKDKTHGIGLDTVKKRLDLIYKNKYALLINSDNSVFKVNLEIELSEN